MKGAIGWIKRTSAFMTYERTGPRVAAAAGALVASRYQSQNSDHANSCSASAATPNSKRSSASVVRSTIADKRVRIHLSASKRESTLGRAPAAGNPSLKLVTY